MCGRFALIASPKEIQSQFHVDTLPCLEPNYNVCPTESILILTQTLDSELRGELFRWGLIPFFSKEIPKSKPMINARSETVEKIPSFQSSFKNKRGLVIMNGFFEWMMKDGINQPYFICRKDNKLIAIASLWDVWESRQGEVVYSCCMITTPPNDFIAPFHDRMPAIINEDKQRLWMDSTITDSNLLKTCFVSPSSDDLRLYPVSRKVGSPYFKNKEAIVPL